MTIYERILRLERKVKDLEKQICCANQAALNDVSIVNIDDDAPDLEQLNTIQILNDGSVVLVNSAGVATVIVEPAP